MTSLTLNVWPLALSTPKSNKSQTKKYIIKRPTNSWKSFISIIIVKIQIKPQWTTIFFFFFCMPSCLKIVIKTIPEVEGMWQRLPYALETSINWSNVFKTTWQNVPQSLKTFIYLIKSIYECHGGLEIMNIPSVYRHCINNYKCNASCKRKIRRK